MNCLFDCLKITQFLNTTNMKRLNLQCDAVMKKKKMTKKRFDIGPKYLGDKMVLIFGQEHPNDSTQKEEKCTLHSV